MRRQERGRGLLFFGGGGGPDEDELAYPAHQVVLKTTPRNQGSELSSSTMILEMTVVRI